MKTKSRKQKVQEQSLQQSPAVGLSAFMSRVRQQGQWPVVGLIIAVLVSLVLVTRPHLTSSDIPFGDGRWYAQQAVELHGLLHSGQIQKFWNLFCQPSTVTLVPSYLLFFMLPSIFATGVVYGVINCVSWHLLLAFSLYGFARLARRPVLAVPVFLLVVANNYVLDASYYYYLDMPFASVCFCGLYLLARALVDPSKRRFALAGCVAGATCFVKPGGAFVFLGLYAIALAIWFVMPLFCHPRKAVNEIAREGGVHIGTWLIAFVPVLAAAASWNLVQRIVQQWVENQGSSYYAEALTVTGLLRWLYFPFCLSYFYSFVVLGIVAVLIVFLCWVTPRQPGGGALQPEVRRVIWVLAIVFVVIWGGVFSWFMTFKPIRSLPLMLPLIWLSIFTLTRLRMMPMRYVCVGAIVYFATAHAQFAWEMTPKVNRSAETYHLTGDWFSRFPARQPNVEAAIGITRMLASTLNQMGVKVGSVAVGTEMLYWNSCSLNWITQLDDLRAGLKPSLVFKTAVDNKGNPIRSCFENVSALVLPVHPSVQYSREVYRFNVVVAQYAGQHWQTSGKAKVNVLKFGDGQPGVAIVVFKTPLTMGEWDAFVSANFTAGYSAFSAASETFNRRMTWSELWQKIQQQRVVSREGK